MFILMRGIMSLLVDLVKEDYGIRGSDRWWRSEVHSSLVVDAERDLYFFNARELKGNAIHYLINIRGFNRKSAEEFVKRFTGVFQTNRETGLQVRFEKLVDCFYENGLTQRIYWYNRGLTDSTISRYRLGYYDGWYTIPIYDNGLFFNFQCRRDNPKRIKFWYKDSDFRPVLYNKDILKFVDKIYITEGMVDCILLNQLGFPAVCTTNGAMSWNPEWIKYFTKINDIYYIADNDLAGIKGALSVSNSLGSRVKILRFKDKEEKYGAKNFFVNDNGTKEEFMNLFDTNSVYGFEKGVI